MEPQVIDIPNVGKVEFPASMSQDEVSAAAKRLYDEANKEPVTERESPELFGSAGAGLGAVGAVGDVIYSKGRPLIRAGEKLMGMEPSGPPKVKPRTFQDPSTVAQGAIERRTAADLPEGTTTTVRNWTAGKPGAGTGQQAGEFLGGANYSEADKFAKERLAFETANPTMKVQPGSRLAIPEQEADVLAKQRAALQAQANAANQAEVNAVAQTRADRLQERNTLKDQANRKNMLTGSANVVGRGVLPIMGGYEAGAQGAQAYNRLTRPDLTASDAAAGAANVVGSAAGMRSMFPGRARIPAAILSQGASAIANFLDKRNPRNEPEEQTAPGMAMGGSVTPSPKLKSLSDFLDQLMQQSTAPAPAPAPAAPQGGVPPGMPPQGGMPGVPGVPGVPPQQPPMQQSPLNAMMPQMAKGGKVGALGSVAKKLSEVLVPREGQTIIGTMADRTKATEGFSGGPGFINLHPEYTWAMDAPGAASRLLNVVNAAGGPERTVVAPMLMSKTAHKSNRPVFEKIYKELQEDIRSGKVTPEQVEALNKRLAIEKGLEASPGIDSKDFLEFANAFHRRGSVADIFGKKRIGAVDLQRHLDETIDPALRESELGAIGPQLFTAESQLLRPDVHPGYKYVLTGEKGADQFTPVPREFLFRDLESKAMKELGRPLSDYNYRTSVGVPSQLIDEKLIRSLEELGYKKGGLV